jgi:glycosyltransferase involved in cell wall biosynthesis
MRVLYLIDRLQLGGAEYNTLLLISELQRRGVDCSLLTRCEGGDRQLASVAKAFGIRHFDLNAKSLFDPVAAVRFIAQVRHIRPDVIHLQDPDGALLAVLARGFWSAPQVITRHVLAHRSRSARSRLRSLLVLHAARYAADRGVAVSSAVSVPFSKQTGIALNRIRVIHNGVEVNGIRNSPEELRGRYGWQPGECIVLMVAVMRPGKGHDILLDSVEQVLAGKSSARVKFVGDGALRPDLERRARAFGPAVEFLGERSDVRELMAASDVVALPSLSEALPTVLLEAAAEGVPAVASAVGGIPEIVIDQETGVLVEPGDSAALARAIIDLLNDDEKRRRLGAAARLLATKRFTIERQATETLQLYRELIS